MSDHTPRWRAALVRLSTVAILAPLALTACHGAREHEPHPAPSPITSSTATAGPTSLANPLATASPAAPSGSAGHTPAHVVVVVFENKSYGQIAGSTAAPWINSLMASSAVFTVNL